jgi:hypothetical protein
MKFDEDIDKKPILGVYLQRPLYEKKEGKLNSKFIIDQENADENEEENHEDFQPFAKFENDPLFKVFIL